MAMLVITRGYNKIDGLPNFKIVVFHSYVSLPEGKSQFLNHHFFRHSP